MLLDEGDNLDPDILEMIGVINRMPNDWGISSMTYLHFPVLRPMKKNYLFHQLLYVIVNEAVDKQMNRADRDGISFQVAVDEDLDVYANRDALNHIVGMVENAVKYNRKNGLVTLRVAYRPDYNCILFEVIDFGYGISEIDQKKILRGSIVFQIPRPETYLVQGLDSIVKRLVDRMGARIEVRSKINQGTVFRISFCKRYLKTACKCDVRK